VTVKRLALVSFLLATGSSANASPPWLLSELFVRADTIALVTVIAPDAHSVVLRSKTLYRGARLPAQVRIEASDLPKDVSVFLALSQGDKPFGPPTDQAQLGQGIEGQRGYRGWILYPIRHVNDHDIVEGALFEPPSDQAAAVRVDQLPMLIGKQRYRERGE
jgi:hypothetical protein